MNNISITLYRNRNLIVTEYPSTISKMRGFLRGTAFFPGGQGLYIRDINNPPSFPVNGIMVLGQDFDNAKGFQDTIQNGDYDELNSKTWRNMLSIFTPSGINPSDCFFTNAIMGVRNTESNVGESPAFSAPVFLEQCRSFFLYQLNVQKPKLVIVLGTKVIQFLTPLSQRFNEWSPYGLKNFGARQNWILDNVSFESIPDYSTRFVFLIHPSMLMSNVRHIKFDDLKGIEAIYMLLRKAKENIQL